MKVGVGISGGVDSAVAAMLLKSAGHEVVGYTMCLGRVGEGKALSEAKSVADWLGIRLFAIDCSEEWRDRVCAYLRNTYLAGQTPNPCVRCNETVKFGVLPKLAFAYGCERFATGHYSRLDTDASGRVFLRRGADRKKDQSYFLYRVSRETLSRTLFPLGGMTKADVRQMAHDAGFAVAEKSDSQDFCGGDPMEIVGAEDRVGNIVDTSGKILGQHNGFWHFTPGKRKGLGVGGGTPYYVVRLDAERNEVIVAFKEASIVREFRLSDEVWLADADYVRTVQENGGLFVKVRSAGEPKGPVSFDGHVVKCANGLIGVAPGQSAVFYDGDTVLGGGLISAT